MDDGRSPNSAGQAFPVKCVSVVYLKKGDVRSRPHCERGMNGRREGVR